MDAEMAPNVVNSIVTQNETDFWRTKSRDQTICLKRNLYFADHPRNSNTLRFPFLPHFLLVEDVPLPRIILFMGQCGGGECGTSVYVMWSAMRQWCLWQLRSSTPRLWRGPANTTLIITQGRMVPPDHFGRHHSTIHRLRLVRYYLLCRSPWNYGEVMVQKGR